MTSQTSFRRKIIYVAAIAVLLGPMFLLAQPSTGGTEDEEPNPGGMLAKLRSADPENDFSYAQLGEIDPTSETFRLATLGLRGIAAQFLWHKANNYKMKGDWTNLSATLEQLTKVEPHFISVWRFQAWNLSYNVSAEFDDYRDRFHWVIEGIKFLQQGLPYNRRQPRLRWDLGWFNSQKIGKSDERKEFRDLYRSKENNDFFDTLPAHIRDAAPDRDNWLVGKAWYLEMERMVDNNQGSMTTMSELLFRSEAPMCQIQYADALEDEGTFGRKATDQWNQSSDEWDRYGDRLIPTTAGDRIQLNKEEVYNNLAEETIAELDALDPGLRERIREQRRQELSPQQREALDTAPADRTREQHELVYEANQKLEVNHRDVAKEIYGADREKAYELAEQAAEYERLAKYIRRYKEIVNFDYWDLRCQVEKTPAMVDARRGIFEGDQLYREAKPDAARRSYEEGLQGWRTMIDKYPGLLEDEIETGDDLMKVIERYRKILRQNNEELPEDFILNDVIERYGELKEEIQKEQAKQDQGTPSKGD